MYFHRQWYPPPPLISYIITHQNPKSTPIVPLCELAQCLLPGSKNWGMMGSQPRENPMANRYSVLVPHQPQESESCLSEDRAWDLCYSLAEDFGYAEIRDPYGNHIGDYGNPSCFLG